MPEGKTALVLSAGGMFGAYQAGAWEELSCVFDPEIVVGASVGSLNAWMVASGAPASDMVVRWQELNPAGQVRWRLPRNWAEGCIDSSELDALIQEMCAKQPLQRAYGVVLTELRRMKPRLFRAPEVDWRHVSASCSVPGFLHQHKIEGRYYSDGGIVDPLPLWAALEMGATRIVAINVMKHRPFLFRNFVRCIQAYARYREPDCGRVTLVEISPSSGLGSARDSMYWSEANNERWLEAGRRDARASLGRVVECLLQTQPQGDTSLCTNTGSTE